MPHIYYSYRATSGTIMPTCEQYSCARHLAEADLVSRFKRSATPLVTLMPPFTTQKQIALYLALCKSGLEAAPGHQTGLRFNLEHLIKALKADHEAMEPDERIAERRKAARRWIDEYERDDVEMDDHEKSLLVLALTRETSDYLAEVDPQALKQSQTAINGKSWENYL